MLPIILGLIGGGLIVSAFTEDDKYAKGGSIPNNYKGKGEREIWEMWTTTQRKHFLEDHRDKYSDNDVLPKYTNDELAHFSFDELPSIVQSMVYEHIIDGQYAKGGMFEKPIPAIIDDYGNIKSEKKLQQDLEYLKEAYEDKLITKDEFEQQLIEIKEQIKFLQKKDKGGTMAKGGILKEDDMLWDKSGKKYTLHRHKDGKYMFSAYLKNFGSAMTLTETQLKNKLAKGELLKEKP